MASDFCDVRLSSGVESAVTIATARFHYAFAPGQPVRVLTSEWSGVLRHEIVNGKPLFELVAELLPSTPEIA